LILIEESVMISNKVNQLMAEGRDRALKLLPEWNSMDKYSLSLGELVFVWKIMDPGSPEKAEALELIHEMSENFEDHQLVFLITFFGDANDTKAREVMMESIMLKAERLLSE
jgi:hypothetical protein